MTTTTTPQPTTIEELRAEAERHAKLAEKVERQLVQFENAVGRSSYAVDLIRSGKMSTAEVDAKRAELRKKRDRLRAKEYEARIAHLALEQERVRQRMWDAYYELEQFKRDRDKLTIYGNMTQEQYNEQLNRLKLQHTRLFNRIDAVGTTITEFQAMLDNIQG